jgi:hypothetical protein
MGIQFFLAGFIGEMLLQNNRQDNYKTEEVINPDYKTF